MTPEEKDRAYAAARAELQAKANSSGYDHGIFWSDALEQWSTFMLSARQRRFGLELTCEVVSCEDLAKCQPGHGPLKD